MIKTVAVLYGGNSAEREISLQSGQAVIQALKDLDIQVIALDTCEPFIDKLVASKCDVAFIALHGRGGEDGCIQGLLESLQIPYTGSGVLGSALAMDKLKSKQIWRAIGLLTAEFLELPKNADAQTIADQIGMPLVIKPIFEGSSIGISCSHSVEELAQAICQAQKYGPALCERYIEGEDYTVGIIGNQALPVIKIVPEGQSFYDFEAKYISNATQYICPAQLSIEETTQLQQTALQAFKAVGCSGWGRVDFMRDNKTGKFYLLEVNTIPGLTSHSLVPLAASKAKLNFKQLILKIIERAIATDSSTSGKSHSKQDSYFELQPSV